MSILRKFYEKQINDAKSVTPKKFSASVLILVGAIVSSMETGIQTSLLVVNHETFSPTLFLISIFMTFICLLLKIGEAFLHYQKDKVDRLSI